MKIESFDGIVLSETNYSESSKILNVLTKEYGLIGVMSKGCRNIKSKLRGVSRKLVYGTFHVYYKENGQWIEETTTRKVSEDEVPASIRNKINRKEADITEEIEKELKLEV